jgi:hypothetical protein
MRVFLLFMATSAFAQSPSPNSRPRWSISKAFSRSSPSRCSTLETLRPPRQMWYASPKVSVFHLTYSSFVIISGASGSFWLVILVFVESIMVDHQSISCEERKLLVVECKKGFMDSRLRT